MDIIEETIWNYNPWWRNGSLDNDPHLKRFDTSSIQWTPPAMEAISMRFGDTHTLRGPRQVGKTTTIKRIIRQLVKAGETRVLYFAFDYAISPNIFEEVIQTAKRLHPDPDGPWYIFLDEVSSIPDWQIGAKVAWDKGLTSEDALLLTASSAHDLQRGAERLPGRRGKGQDFLQLPMSFRDFAEVAHGIQFMDEPLDAESFLTDQGARSISRLMAQRSELEMAFRRYSKTGGFPLIVKDYVEHLKNGTYSDKYRITSESIQVLWNVIAGDITKARREPVAALKLLQATGNSLGSTLSWLSASRAMGFEKPDSARQYAEFLAETYALLAVYFWDIERKSLEPRKQRKLYFIDPVIGLIPSRLIPGTTEPGDDGTVENIVAIALFRSASQTLFQANAVPGAVGYWRSKSDREIDFVIPSHETETISQNRFPIEVKGDNRTGLSAARRSIELAYGRGLVLSRSIYEWSPTSAIIPVWAFLAGLNERALRQGVV